MNIRQFLLSVMCFIVLLAAGRCGQCEPISFRRDIAPLLLDKCLACHSADNTEGGYRVDSFQRTMAPGDSDLTPFAAGKLDDSEAYRRIASDDEDERMPLDGDPLSAEQVALFRQWIEQGTVFDGANPTADLASILPVLVHPAAPARYPTTLPVTALAFTPHGEQIVVGGYHELTYWDPDDGSLIRRVGNVGQRVYALDFAPDGKSLAVACGNPGQLGEVRVVDVQTDSIEALLTTTDVVLDVRFSPDGSRLAACGADDTVRIFELATRSELRSIASHSDWVTAVAWSGDGTKLASSSRDKSAKAFDAETGQLLITYSGHGELVSGVAFHPDGGQVYSAGADRKIHLWNLNDGKKAAELTGFGGEVFDLAIAGNWLFATSADKTARQFDATTRKQECVYSGHPDWVLSTAYHQETGRLATGCFDGSVRVWSTKDGKQLTEFVAKPEN